MDGGYSRVRPVSVLSVISAAILGLPGFGARLDAGGGLAVSAPQNHYFGFGLDGSLSGELAVLSLLDVELEASYALLPSTSNAPVMGPGTLFSFSAGARLHRPLDDALIIPWVEVAVGLGLSQGARLPLTLTGGVSLHPVDSLGLLVGLFARVQEVLAPGTPPPGYANYNATLLSFGLSVEYLNVEPTDSDGDGLPDSRDACPDEHGRGSANGCPKTADATDDAAKADRDHDGVPDSVDRCPDEPEDRDGYQDEDGCPDPDNDGDGVADKDDQCPNAAGPAALNGCPDADGDGVPDKDDQCPNAAGLKEDHGCPLYKQLVVTETKITIKQKIFFAFGSTKILPKSEPLLTEVAQALKDRSGICVRVEGHTDNKGNRDANMTLSQGRAQAILDYLIIQDVKPERLVAKGYADTLPIDDNKTLEGRENNRRVEFVLINCAKVRP
jgi:outer membrane protein OmpA-like peptidoglycan-associated protein